MKYLSKKTIYKDVQIDGGKNLAEHARCAGKVLNFPAKVYHNCFLLVIILWNLQIFQLQAQEQQDTLVRKFHDKSIPFIDRYYLTGEIYYLSQDQQIGILKTLLPEAKIFDDKKPVMRIYALISDLYTKQFQFDVAKAYLDSAFIYESSMDNHVVLGVTYYITGNYYANRVQHSLSHLYYHKAIENFDAAGVAIFPDLYYDLSIAYKQLKDTLNMRKLIDRITLEFDPNITDKSYGNILMFSIYASYFEILYEARTKVAYLDSMGFYTRKAIDQFRQTESLIMGSDYQVAYNYMDMAKIFLLKKPVNYIDSALHYAAEAKRLSNPNQQIIPMGYHAILGEVYCIENKWDRAEQEYRIQLDLLKSEPQLEFYLEYANIYKHLALVCEKQGKLKEALQFQNLCLEYTQKLFDRNSYETIQELQTRYEVAKREEDIQQLTERNRYQERIRYLTLGILGLTLLAAILGFLWFRRKRKSDADALKIAKFQQQEAELKAEVEAAKLEEKEKEFDALASDMEMRQIRSYLDGLEAERTRLAGELHDNVSNALLGVEFKMRTPGASQQEVSVMLHGIHEHVRNISHALMPPVFQHATLAEIITDYVYMQNGMNGPRFECHIEPENGWEDLPQETALELHRIVQEACGNALKHSGASLISIILQRNGDRVTLIVNDNGRGMDVNSKKTGLGLQIIRDRAAKMNGLAEIVSSTGKGTTITVAV